MLRKIILLTCAFLNVLLLFSQQKVLIDPPIDRKTFDSQVNIVDANGRPFKSNLHVEGSPFFADDLKSSTVRMKSGLVFEKGKARIDLWKKEIHFITENNVDIITSGESVKEITLLDSLETDSAKRIIKFKTGFPAIDNQNESSFYQVLSEKDLSFLKSLAKKIIEKKNDITGEISAEFETFVDYYIFTGKEMIKLKKEKEWLLSFMLKKKEKINSFLAENKINFKKIDDLVVLFKYYNSL